MQEDTERKIHHKGTKDTEVNFGLIRSGLTSVWISDLFLVKCLPSELWVTGRLFGQSAACIAGAFKDR
jgi:hypothetical protein